MPALAFSAALVFTLCGAAPRQTCVVDGDTFWLAGEKVRIADINAPETSQAQCPSERLRGEAAKLRLLDLLNQGPVELLDDPRSRDRYGRRLAVVLRGGKSLGSQLVAEGLAEPWRGQPSSWCAAAN
ncbi:thermonuclease family protein [Novosphingobium ginsenosidimutans]|uniref:Thermonuclease family protein n=1 Tax=Novosphingobium ginsenosidimutans TaxID=1176536 RepID=A0A5B8S237_9SPHN|nr:thermonuclease family protein [Novosphingobium ginsenosidimutans]QEA15420.1 thermonuclease family protein [Novosphingobium ginsenosidimutans]